jgi:O-glycosyl hydrolase
MLKNTKIAQSVSRAGLLCAMAVTCFASSAQSTTFTLQSGVRQEIKGWGLAPGYARSDWNNNRTDEWTWVITKPAIQQAIYTDLNYNYVRVDIQPRFYDAGAFDKVNKTTIVDLVNLLRTARNRGKTKWIVSIWSPPAAFKTPQVTPGLENGQKVTLNPAKVDEFTQYLVNCLLYLNSQGLGLPEMISPQNEPDYATSYDSCFYGDSKSVYQDVVKSLRAKLNNAGLTSVKVGASEAGSQQEQATFLGSNFTDLGSDTTLRNSIDAVVTHTYDDWSYDDASYFAIKNMNTPNTTWGKPLWQTEYSLAPLQGESWTEMQAVLGTWGHFSRDLVMTNYEYWFWWFGFNKAADYYQSLLYGRDATKPQKLKNYYIFQKLWANVPADAGFRVQKFTSDDSAFISEYIDAFKRDPSNYPHSQWGNKKITRPVHLIAFTNGTKTVLLIINDTATDKQVTIQGLPGSSYRKFETTATTNMVDKGSLNVINNSIQGMVLKNTVNIYVSNA